MYVCMMYTYIQRGARIVDTFVKSTHAVSSQHQCSTSSKLLDKMEVILNMCYHDTTFQGLKK